MTISEQVKLHKDLTAGIRKREEDERVRARVLYDKERLAFTKKVLAVLDELKEIRGITVRTFTDSERGHSRVVAKVSCCGGKSWQVCVEQRTYEVRYSDDSPPQNETEWYVQFGDEYNHEINHGVEDFKAFLVRWVVENIHEIHS